MEYNSGSDGFSSNTSGSRSSRGTPHSLVQIKNASLGIDIKFK